MQPFISIVIPTYEANNRAEEFLTTLLGSIKSQDFKDYEVIVADHSTSDVVEKFCESFDLDIQHFYNERGRGNSSINMNEGIKRAVGKWIKIMHMDDFFVNNKALSMLHSGLEKETDKKWFAFRFNHLYETDNNNVRRDIIPSDDTTYGCPSVTGFLNKEDIFFDENIYFLNDMDMNIRLRGKYGVPHVVKQTSVRIRIHSNQVSAKERSLESKEKAYVLNKDYSQWKTS